MSGFSSINLSELPALDVIKLVEYEALLAEMKAEAIRLMPELEAYLSLESEPTTQLLRVCAYFRMLDQIEFNDGARANMLAHSTGTNLDGLAAFWGVERQIVQQADDTISPPIEEIKESDTAFRSRIQLSMEGHTTAGPRGSYIYWARSASGEVKDAGVTSPNPGEVVVTILSHLGDGTPSNTLLSTVETVVNADDVRPLTDLVTVQAAAIIPYHVEASLILYDGPEAGVVKSAAEAALTSYIDAHHRLGHDITLSGLHAALHQTGVQNVLITQPIADIVVSPVEAAFCASDAQTISVGGRDV